MPPAGWAVVLVMLIFFLGGCVSTERQTPVRETVGPRFEVENFFVSPDYQVPSRVLVLPVHYPLDLSAGDRTLWDAELQRVLSTLVRFETYSLNRREAVALLGAESLPTGGPLSRDLLIFAEQSGCDAILIPEFTFYSPYRPLAVSFRGRLLDAESLENLWLVDQAFDSGNPDVSRAARAFQMEYNRGSYPLDTSDGVLTSPRAFVKYVLKSSLETLPR